MHPTPTFVQRTLLALSLVSTICLATSETKAEDVVALTSAQTLLRFDTETPGTTTAVSISGVGGGETLVSIDMRPHTGQLYALGSLGNLYQVSIPSGAATKISSSPLALSGTKLSLNFNSAVDRIRIVSNVSQNLRVNPSTGALAGSDTALFYAPSDDGEGSSPVLTGLAYDASYAGSSTTSVYGIDSSRDTLVRIGKTNVSPNSGTLFTIGALGVDLSASVAFDISGITSDGYVAAVPTGASSSALYRINLVNGALTTIGAITSAGQGVEVLGLALFTPPVTTIYTLGSSNTLNQNSAEGPGVLISSAAITGVSGTLVAIDCRPSDSGLYGVTSAGALYSINPLTAAATLIGTGSGAPGGSNFDIDFNPVADRLRLVSDTDVNERFNATTAVVSIDTSLAFAVGDTNFGDNPEIVGIAYTNSTPGSATTALYGLDRTNDALVSIAVPNTGQLTTVASLGLSLTSTSGLDIEGGTNIPYIFTGGSLYALSLTTGLTSALGSLSGSPIDIAVAPAIEYNLSSSSSSVLESAGNATITVTRSSGRGTGLVSYRTTGGSAARGTDYTSANGTLEFADGETSKTISVAISNDALVESSETFTVELLSVNGGYLGSTTAETVTIIDSLDSDGDGFSNLVEAAAGSDPFLTSSTPFGSSGPGTAKTLSLLSAKVNLNFRATGRDQVTLQGSLSLPKSFTTSGKKAVVDFGGVVRGFTLNSRGTGKNGSSSFSYNAKTKRISITLKGSGIRSALIDENLINDTAVKAHRTVKTNLFINNTVYRRTASLQYTAIENRSGAATGK